VFSRCIPKATSTSYFYIVVSCKLEVLVKGARNCNWLAHYEECFLDNGHLRFVFFFIMNVRTCMIWGQSSFLFLQVLYFGCYLFHLSKLWKTKNKIKTKNSCMQSSLTVLINVQIAYFVGVQMEEKCKSQDRHGLSPETRQLCAVGAVKVAVRSLSMGASCSKSSDRFNTLWSRWLPDDKTPSPWSILLAV